MIKSESVEADFALFVGAISIASQPIGTVCPLDYNLSMAVLVQTFSPQAELQQIVRRIVEAYAPDKIILYGSHAYGTPGPDSDFDLLIIKDSKSRPIDRRVEVGLALLPVLKQTPVEPLVLTPAELAYRLRVRDQFYQEIVTKGKVLYER
jgi:predicted nucleotidyltransferase